MTCEEILFSLEDRNHIRLQVGAPDPSLLPVDILKKHSFDLFNVSDVSHESTAALQYGPSLGTLEFRNSLSKFLNTEYNGYSVLPQNLCATSGASQSFFNLLSFFTANDTVFFIENPTYFLALKMLQDHGVSQESCIPIPVNDDGISIDILQKHLKNMNIKPSNASSGTKKRFPFFLFMVPTFSNPLGISLSAEKRQQLVALAREHDMLVVCDDVYQLLHFNNELPIPRLVSYDLETMPKDGFGNVISNCSFSKLFAPGMRTGWIEAGQGIINQMLNSGLLYSGGCSNQMGTKIMARVISCGDLKIHLDKVRKIYEDRCKSMISVLENNLGKNFSFTRPKGGYFIWLTCSDKSLDTELLLAAMNGTGDSYRGISRENVSFTPGNKFSVDGTHGNSLRLSFGMYSNDDLVLGCERLCSLLNKMND